MPRWPQRTPPLDAKPLAPARRNLSRLARERKAAAKREAAVRRDVEAFAAGQPVPPGPSGVEAVAAVRQSVDARTKLLEQIRQQVERILGQSSTGDLKRLTDALSLHERRFTRRERRKED